MKRKSYFTISLFNFDCLMEMAKKLISKTKMRMKKFRKMKLNFEFSMSKLGYATIFMKILEENNLTHFLRHFWPIVAKMKMLMKIFWKMSLIYEFSISKFLMRTFSRKSENKFFDSFLSHFWLIGAKMKMKMKKYGELSSIFEFSISKLGYMELFIKIWNFYLQMTY